MGGETIDGAAGVLGTTLGGATTGETGGEAAGETGGEADGIETMLAGGSPPMVVSVTCTTDGIVGAATSSPDGLTLGVLAIPGTVNWL